MDSIGKLTRLSSILAFILAGFISVGIPAGYFLLGYQNLRTAVETELHMNSIFLSQVIGKSPEYWRYEERKLSEILVHHTSKKFDEMRSVVDSGNEIIARVGGAIAPPFITVSHDLYDSGNVIGRIEISTSLRPLLMNTIFAAVFALLFGLAIFGTLKLFPLRALSVALQALYEEKEKALAILNNIPDIAWMKNREDRYIAANGPFARICGVASENLPGKTDLDLWPLELAEQYRADDREVMESGKPKQIEEQISDTEGRVTWINTIKTPIFNESGEVIGTTGIARDFTGRKQLEEELKFKNSILSTQQETSIDGILIVDGRGAISSYNRRFVEMWGIPAELVEAGDDAPVLQFVADKPVDPEGFLGRVRYLYEHREEKSHEEIALNDGRVFDRYSAPITGPDLEYYGRVWYFRDITERKSVEESLKKEKEFTQALIDCMPGIFYLIDDKGMLRRWNRNIEEVLGYSAEEISSHPPLYFFAAQDQEIISAKLQEVFAAGKAVAEAKLVSKGGQAIPYLLTGVRIENVGTRYIVGIGMDISEIKRAEEEIKRLNENLELKVLDRTRQLLDAQEELVRKEKLSILGQLSGSVGHELRNPLGVMSNAIYYLKMVNADADETTIEYLDIIKHEIDNSQRIITDLLDFARTGSPQTKIISLHELLAEVLEKCVIPENIELHTELQGVLPLITIDSLQMGQVFQNLVTNAVQAMPAGGALRIIARRVQGSGLKVQGYEKEIQTVNIAPDAGFIEISVTDSGEGISPENMKKLFQPLFTTKAKGVGLGLAICRNLTEANGGSITVKSELGKGATFSILLPAVNN